jgi:F420-dependent oxidoreductase-like protein
MEIALMIEGQNGLTWPRWQRLAAAAEELGFAGLFRSDHFTNAAPPDRESLELWVSLAWLASHSRRLAFGPLVTPLSFRDPVLTARMARDVDDLSGGRLTLGLGAGWQQREHEHFGYNLLDIDGRFRRLREGVEIVTRLLRSDEPVTFAGEFYRLQEAVLLPRPQRPGGPPLLIGGNGPRRTLPLAAQVADEWNATFQTPAGFAALSARLDARLQAAGRPADAVRRSLMTGAVFGRDAGELAARLAARGRTAEELRARGLLVGTGAECAEQLAALAAAGVQRVMIQWLELDDLAGLEALARAVLPAL